MQLTDITVLAATKCGAVMGTCGDGSACAMATNSVKTCFKASKASLVEVTIKSCVLSGSESSVVSLERLW